VHFLQIWIEPDHQGLKPRYQQKVFPVGDRTNCRQLKASPSESNGSVLLHQDAGIYGAQVESGVAIEHELNGNRGAWVHLIRGDTTIKGRAVTGGDGVAIQAEPSVAITALKGGADLLLFDLP
jgi:redox-sensitive bicupin YhaK (pirin superfamily)